MAKAKKEAQAPQVQDTAPVEPGKAGAHPVAREALDAFGIDAVCERIGEGESLTAIAEQVGVSIGSLLTWLKADAERSARAREARKATAQTWDEKAEAELRAATDAFELARARELASHFRWRAKAIAPLEYGDKVALTDGEGKALAPVEVHVHGREPAPRDD